MEYLYFFFSLMILYGWIPLGIIGALLFGISTYNSLTGKYGSSDRAGMNGGVLGTLMMVFAGTIRLAQLAGLIPGFGMP